MIDADGADERSLTRDERRRVALWLLVAATFALGVYGCTKLVVVPSDPTPPERAVMRRSGDVVSVAMAACRGSVGPSPFEVMLAQRGAAQEGWTLVYSGVPDARGWLNLPADALGVLEKSSAGTADRLLIRTTLRGTTREFEAIGELELSEVRDRLDEHGDWLMTERSDSGRVPSDLCHP